MGRAAVPAMDASERQVASTTGAMAGTAARPTVFWLPNLMEAFAADGLPEKFQRFLVRCLDFKSEDWRLSFVTVF